MEPRENLRDRQSRNKSRWLWVPPHASTRDLVACYVRDAERRGVLRRRNARAIARALGLERRTVSRALRSLPGLCYSSSWRPIAWEALPLPIRVADKILASHIKRRGPWHPGAYAPSVRDYAEDLGWELGHTERVLRRCLRTGIVAQAICPTDGRRRIRKWHIQPGNLGVRGRGTWAYAAGEFGRTQPVYLVNPVSTHPSMPAAVTLATEHPNSTLTSFADATGPMDGWEALLSETGRSKLAAGAHAPSIFVALGAAGLYERDPGARARLAHELAARGVDVEHVLAAIEAAFRPRRSEGRVKNPRAVLSTWFRGDIPARREPPLVGAALRDQIAARRAAETRRQQQQGETAERVARIRSSIPAAGDGSRELMNALQAAVHELPGVPDEAVRHLERELYGIMFDARLGIPGLLDFVVRVDRADVLLSRLSEAHRAMVLAERARPRDPGAT